MEFPLYWGLQKTGLPLIVVLMTQEQIEICVY